MRGAAHLSLYGAYIPKKTFPKDELNPDSVRHEKREETKRSDLTSLFPILVNVSKQYSYLYNSSLCLLPLHSPNSTLVPDRSQCPHDITNFVLISHGMDIYLT